MGEKIGYGEEIGGEGGNGGKGVDDMLVVEEMEEWVGGKGDGKDVMIVDRKGWDFK